MQQQIHLNTGIKIIILDNIIEFYEYDYIKKVSSSKQKTQTKTDNTKYNLQRTKTNLIRLIQCNKDLNKFLTLTYARNNTSLTVAYNDLKYFNKKITANYPEYKYIAVPEFQKRGAVHFHILNNLKYVQHKKLENTWNNGFIWINRIDSVKNLGLYITKYITKDFIHKLYKRKKYTTSKNVKKPLIYYDDTALDIFYLFERQLIEKRYYKTKFNGICNFEKYLIIK